MILGMQKFKFIGGTDKLLDKKGFLEMDYATVLHSSTPLIHILS